MLTFDKIGLIRHMIDVYASTLCSSSLPFHVAFYKAVQSIQTCKHDQDILKHYKYIKYIRSHNTLEYMHEYTSKYVPVWMEIRDLISGQMGTNYVGGTMYDVLKTYIKSDLVLCMLQYMKTCLMRQEHFQHVLSIADQLFHMNPKDIFLKQSGSSSKDVCLDIMNVMYIVLLHIVSGFPDDARESYIKYIKISRELSFYKAPLKHVHLKRRQLLYSTFAVVFKRCLDTSDVCVPKQIDKIDESSRYLYMLCEIDEEAIYKVRSDRKTSYMLKHKHPKKSVSVSETFCPKKDLAEIVKL